MFVSQEGGACHALRETVRRVASRGVEPFVVVPECEDSLAMFPKSEFDVAYLKMQRPRRTWNAAIHGKYLASFPSTFLALRRLIRQRGIHLVHFNEITDFIGGMAARSCGVPCVCHVRAHRLPNPYRAALLSTLKATVDAVVVPSKYTASWIASDAAGLADRVKLIHDFAFDLDMSKAFAVESGFRRELGIPAEAILVLLVSKLATPKGHLCFIRAAQKVLKASKEIHFVIVGGPVPGHEGEATEIRRLAEKLTPPPGLQLAGPRSGIPSVFQASNIVVHCPVYPDPFPTVVLLGMLAGKPVIASRIGGIPEQIEDGRTGILVPPDDADCLANAILQLARDPAKRELLGSAARETVREQWLPDAQGQMLADLYAEVIKRRGLEGNGIQQLSGI